MTDVLEILTVPDVMRLTRRSRNYVNSATNSGALEELPRTGHRHQYLPEHVNDWILRGTPLMPTSQRRRR
ncbi:hypothetical protein MYK68_18560 [Gordonia sp. PP30]|uniref:hypothetical protein n=1 Tax=Gordonia sp. PP30 TaxID=2935861 RepID=UPI001FFFC171|nr:hypothetical protein [Gordonia sp. PP30]UQE74687.1 hypothetical protein MYK68_18560 [Gordonia sp. PP30]